MNNEIRKSAYERRGNLDKAKKIAAEEAIFEKLIASKEYIESDVVYVYVSKPYEVSTKKIIEHAVATDKCICVPKVISPGFMEFYEINSMNELEIGYKEILEPVDGCIERYPDEFDKPLVVCPLVAFDDNLNRVGSGKGFYDRYLAKYKNTTNIAIAFECQKSEGIVADKYDIKMNKIITEDREIG